MRKYEELCLSIIVARQEICERVIGEMADAAHHALLHAPRIRTVAKLLQVVIRLDHQQVTATQVIADIGRNVSEIGADANLDSFRSKREADWIDRVMRNSEGRHGDVADGERPSCAEVFASLEHHTMTIGVTHAALIGLVGRSGDVDGNLQLARENANAGDVVRVFVGHQNGINGAVILTTKLQAAKHFTAGYAGIDQQAGAGTGDKSAVPFASA